MKSARIIGIAAACFASVLMMSMALASSASAAPVWEQCSEGGSATKYSEHQCVKAEGGGKWQWNEISNSEEVRIKGSLRLTSTNVPIVKKVVIECSGESVGFVGPGIHGRITEVKTTPAQCKNIENCEKVEKIEAVHLPWQTENTTVGTSVVALLKSVKPEKGNEPGWAATCKVLGNVESNVCESEVGLPESLLLSNKETLNGSTKELLVLATFQQLRKAACTLGGKETKEAGSVSGSLSILKLPVGTEGPWGLRVA